MQNPFMTSYLFALFFLSTAILGQTAEELYLAGSKALQKNQFLKADSLFTLSLNIDSHLDSYLNRAIARNKMGRGQGYCEDLRTGAALGDKEAHTAFIRDCGSADTILLNEKGGLTSAQNEIAKEITYQTNYPGKVLKVQLNYKNEFLGISWPSADADTLKKSGPSFPGGLSALMTYLQRNVQYPRKAREEAISGTVEVKFTVNERGLIKNVIVLKSLSKECDAESIRVIKAMPGWYPGRVNDHPAMMDYTMSVNYKIQ